ncbi:gag/pol protein [Cucumis melo var. makuwa]|uniref:Gag/pol protein n=1 Tax=Cucumis melo var. makuwa TaxID=1194695 RepID=A0A5D3DKI6_CUCMM|nr:gag/pol protein [Cucumis melo var. makuwa]TYK24143.1 gag/pol protein [Cucumis melo var. makuwa]
MRYIPYASAIGNLMYTMLCTIPDICYAVVIVSKNQSNIGLAHWTVVKTILKYLRRPRDYMLMYGSKDLILTGYTDSNFQTNRDSRKSTSSSMFTLNGGAVVWRSIKQGSIVDSPWRQSMSQLVKLPKSGAVAKSREPRSHKRGKHIERKYHWI